MTQSVLPVSVDRFQAEGIDSRLTPIQAIHRWANQMELKRLPEDATREDKRAAYAKDHAAGQALIEMLVEDLEKISGRKFEKAATVIGPSGLSGARAWMAITLEIYVLTKFERIIKSLQCINRTDKRWFFPMSPVSLERENADFQHLAIDGEVYDVRMKNISFKCPDDFVRRIPGHAQKKLRLLATTHFNYKPKILDGTLVGFQRASESVPLREEINLLDPALVVQFANESYCRTHNLPRYVAVDHWFEPCDGPVWRFLVKSVSIAKILAESTLYCVVALLIAGMAMNKINDSSQGAVTNFFENLIGCVGLIIGIVMFLLSSQLAYQRLTRRFRRWPIF